MTDEVTTVAKDAPQLFAFHWDCGRMGDVEGLFIATQAQLDAAYGKRVYFGEILGKHSEIYGNLDKQDISVKSNDQSFIEKLQDVLGGPTISGWNPLEYIEEQEESPEDEGEE